MAPDDITNTTDPVQQAPHTEAQADPNASSATTVGTDTSATSQPSEPQPSASPASTATPGDAQSEINPSNALAGTSGKLAGTNASGMAAGSGVEKVAPVDATDKGDNAGVDTPGVNVAAPGAPNPIVQLVTTQVADLRSVVSEVHKQTPTPFLDRALKDLQAFEEWVVQHFEELKRKL